MSAALLLPNLTPEHDAAVAGLPEGVADDMLQWASDQQASVREMLAWGRFTYPDAETSKPTAVSEAGVATTPSPERRDKRSPQRAKRNAAVADGLPRGGQEPAGSTTRPLPSAREESPPPRGALNRPVTPDSSPLTVRITAAECLLASQAIRDWIHGTPRGWPKRCDPDSRAEAERLASLLALHGAGIVQSVTLPRTDWLGVSGDRVRHPGIVGLLYGADVEGPAGWLAWRILRRIEGVM